MARKNSAVVIFHNITDEDFEHSYDGFPYRVKAGEKLPLQYPIGMHLAKHLAMKILRAKKKATGVIGDKDNKGQPINIYTKPEMEKLVNQIILEKIERPAEAIPDPRAEAQKKAEALKEEFKDRIESKPVRPEVSKKEVIEELKKRGIKHDPRAPKEELLQLVVEAESKGE